MEKYDYAIIGAGPGGYVSAIRAGQLGLKTVLIEKNERLGGTCLNIGCIPSKVLLQASELFAFTADQMAASGIKSGEFSLDLAVMMKQKEKVVATLTDGIRMLMKKNKVTVLHGVGSLLEPHKIEVKTDDSSVELQADSICLATGSVPVQLPFLPFDGRFIISSTDALSLDKVPKHLVVIGAGAVGLELGSVWKRLGAEVTVVELLPQIIPFADKQLATLLERSLKKQGMTFLLKTKVTGVEFKRGKVNLQYEDSNGEKGILSADKVLVSVGRKPNPNIAGAGVIGVQVDESGRVPVDERWRTNIPHIFAIGDLIEGPMLAHKAQEEGVAVAEIIAGKAGYVNYDTIPNIVYTWPELASVGINEKQAAERGLKVKVGKFYYRGNGRALSMGESEGMAKVVADARTDELLGVHIFGAQASEIIAEAVVAMEFHASAEDLARTVHAHPTLAEVLKEAALAVDKRAIHG